MIKHTFLSLSAVLAALALTACGGGGGSGGGAAGAVSAATTTTQTTQVAAASAGPVEPFVRTGEPENEFTPMRERDAQASPPPASVVLGTMSSGIQKTLVSAPSQAHPITGGQPTQIGVARAVGRTMAETATGSLLTWKTSARGTRIAAIRFQSPQAEGIRLGVRVKSLPLGSSLRFYADGSTSAFEISAREVMLTIQRNLDAGDPEENARTYWSPDLGGDSVTLEVEVPSGTGWDETQIAVPHISHLFRKATDLVEADASIGSAGTCNLDVSCNAAYDSQSKSVARMSFVVNGATYFCSGTLLNDRTSSAIPYFLSANHCISSQTVASTLTTDWIFRSSSCNSGQLSLPSKTVYGGAILLYASADTDTSFMQLNSTPPLDAVYAAWSAGLPTVGTKNVVGIHHPKGDLQKYSVGSLTGYDTCSTPSNDGSFSCAPASDQAASFLQVNWSEGVVEPGSSGSGLFTTINGKLYLVGQLYGGTSSCTNPAGANFYGRFDVAFRAALSQWLGATPSTQRIPVYRLYDRQTGTHFYTASAQERVQVASNPQFSDENIAFYAYGDVASDRSPVYRFYNTRSGTHFYTISGDERSNVQSNYPWFAFEGISWYASLGGGNASTPMYRFYNTRTDTHFYTISAQERDVVQNNYPDFRFEGVAYYAWQTP